MGHECLLTHTSQRRNKSQEQALPIPAVKAVPVYGKMPNSLFQRGSPTAMPDMAQLSQCCYRGHHLPACLLKNVTTASVVQLRCVLQEGAHKPGDGCTPRQAEPRQLSSHSSARHPQRCLPHAPNQSWTPVTLQDLLHGAPQLSLIFG